MSTEEEIKELMAKIFPRIPFKVPFDDMGGMSMYLYLKKLEAILRPFWTWPPNEREEFFERYPYLRPNK